MLDILKNRRDFLACAASGFRFSRPTLVMQARARTAEDAKFVPEKNVRVGFTCTKTLGGAVVRNRIKRRLRAAAAQALPEQGKRGYDYVVIGRSKAENCEFSEITSDMTMAIKRLNQMIHEKSHHPAAKAL